MITLISESIPGSRVWTLSPAKLVGSRLNLPDISGMTSHIRPVLRSAIQMALLRVTAVKKRYVMRCVSWRNVTRGQWRSWALINFPGRGEHSHYGPDAKDGLDDLELFPCLDLDSNELLDRFHRAGLFPVVRDITSVLGCPLSLLLLQTNTSRVSYGPQRLGRSPRCQRRPPEGSD